MIKVVYNNCFGGFSLSKIAAERLVELGMEEMKFELAQRNKPSMLFMTDSFGTNIDRHDPRVVQVVEEFGDKASGSFAKLKIAIVYGNRYRIDEYDGRESVVEPDDCSKECIFIK